MDKFRRARWWMWGLLAALVVLTSGCGLLIGPPTVEDASAGELVGEWKGLDGAEMTLQGDGRAEVRNLGGADWDFDQGWGLTGTGTWQLVEGVSRKTIGAAPAVRITITDVTGQIQRPPRDSDKWTTEPHHPIREYTWYLGMERTVISGLQPYCFAGDPDHGKLYRFKRT